MVYLNELLYVLYGFLSEVKHLGMVKCEDRRECAGTSGRLSVYVLTGYNFCPVVSLIQTEAHGLFRVVMKSSKPGLDGFRAVWR